MIYPRYPIIYRTNAAELADAIEVARLRIAESVKILQTSQPPDTFLGRRLHDSTQRPDHHVSDKEHRRQSDADAGGRETGCAPA
ncbi:hypothetical protein Q3C01_43870 [Bradyrhizobium sp. UFLA05-109]